MIQKAIPIFPVGMQDEMNILTSFEATTSDLRNAVIHICAADFYRLFVNGQFVAFGPARAAKGYAREDVIDLTSYHCDGENKIEIQLMHYFCGNFISNMQPGYLLCEVERNGEILLATGYDFTCWLNHTREQKVPRYSSQRHFEEIWDLRKNCRQVPVETVTCPKILDRKAPYPYYEDILLSSARSVGTLEFDPQIKPHQYYYSITISERWGRFSPEEEVSHPFAWVQSNRQKLTHKNVSLPAVLRAGEYAVFDFEQIETGFLALNGIAHEGADLVIAFSEDCPGDEFAFTNMHAHNVVEVTLAAGKEEHFLSFEPYVFRYAMVALRSGSITLDSFGVKIYITDVSSVQIPDIHDEELLSVYRAAVRTYAHNAVDAYTDCPSRERAGWLCDSYFTAKTEYALFGETKVEDAFLENYRLFDGDELLPKGVLPMSYPSDVEDTGKFIPQWTMWYILEAEDYINHRGHKADADQFRDSINGLLAFYEQYENSDGLLEKLPSWNFVEWSKANEWTQDVSYPTNFLYAQVLESVYRIYGDETYLHKANKIRETAVEQSFNGTIFLDHAVRNENGILQRQQDCSEACQYYAILFAGIDLYDEKFWELRRLVLDVFGAERTEEHPEIAQINAFIGAYLRLEVLMKLKRFDLLVRDVKGLFGHMEKSTGTLWEYRQPTGSRDHGFASYALVTIQAALKESDI
jgi:alpha-L-rhamnosidase